MDMHQFLPTARRFQQGVAASGHLAQTRSDGENQVAAFDAISQFGVDADTQVTRI